MARWDFAGAGAASEGDFFGNRLSSILVLPSARCQLFYVKMRELATVANGFAVESQDLMVRSRKSGNPKENLILLRLSSRNRSPATICGTHTLLVGQGPPFQKHRRLSQVLVLSLRGKFRENTGGQRPIQ